VKQRVLVLGAAGFIGSRVVEALAASTWALPIAGVRRRPANGLSTTAAVSVIQMDATDPVQTRAALDGVNSVVNCIAGRPHDIVSSARVLFDAAGDMATPPHIVHLSSLAVYGATTGKVSESSPFGDRLSAYGHAKVAAERVASSYPSVINLRPGIVYGPRSEQWSAVIGHWLMAGRLGDLGKHGDGFCNLVYVDDVVNAITSCVRAHHLSGMTFNLSLPSPPTWNEYFRFYAHAIGALPVARISRSHLFFETMIATPVLKTAEILCRRIRPKWSMGLPQAITPSFIRLFNQKIIMQVSSVEKLLNLRWTPIQTGIAQTSDWYRAMFPQHRI